MSVDNLSKEIKDFEKMTKAVFTLSDAVRDGLLKKQTVKELDTSIELKKKEIEGLDKEKASVKATITSEKAKAKVIVSDAKKKADDIVSQANEDSAAAVKEAKAKVAAERQKVKELGVSIQKLQEDESSIKLSIVKEEKKIGSAKEKLRSLLG
jgi:chromosome segregation ATPase